MTAQGNLMIRAAETSVFSYGETGNLYVQQPQTGFQDQSLSLTESGRGLDILRQRNLQINYACNLYCVFEHDFGCYRIRLIERLALKKSHFCDFFVFYMTFPLVG